MSPINLPHPLIISDEKVGREPEPDAFFDVNLK
jgi:hypothetical protein